MTYQNFYENIGRPFTGMLLKQVKTLLASKDLVYDEGVELTVSLSDSDGNLAATASLQDNVIKCVAVADGYEGEGLSAQLISAVQREAVALGRTHLFLFTKPANKIIFSGLGFYPIMEAPYTMLMENRKDGIKDFVNSLQKGPSGKTVGAIVANCNPFTKGHLYLMEQASAHCDVLHVFILSAEKSLFPADVRLRLVTEGTAHLKNVVIHPTSDYLVSAATFPTYFLKGKQDVEKINCELDLKIFCEYFAKHLGITSRFVGTEPYSPVTNVYNEQMKEVLPRYGIEVVELKRMEQEGDAVSASRVRALLAKGETEAALRLVPPCTAAWLQSEEGRSWLALHLNAQ